MEASPEIEVLTKEVEVAEGRLGAAQTKLRKAEAFKLPEADQLRVEVAGLEKELEVYSQKLQAAVPKQDKQEDAVVHESEKVEEAQSNHGKSLRSRMSLESIQGMSNEERMELAQDLGPAFMVSVGIVASTFWTVCGVCLVYAFQQATGRWPDLAQLTDQDAGLALGGLVATIFTLATVLKPVRLFLAFLLTPWAAENVVPRIPWMKQREEEPK